MGSDNLFHKRKAKAAGSLERRKSKRSSYDKVLIVCEGEKTEPNYFNELIQFYELNTANVAIDGICGSSPKSVFNRAIDLWQKEDQKGDPFDRVYCVFDKDSHETYEATISRVSAQKPIDVFYAAVSIPCFEYWLLLHFKYTTKPYAETGTSSIGNEVLKELKGMIPEYAKGSNEIFSSLYPQLELAKKNAERSLQCANDNHTDNPSTRVHELIDYLQNLK
ncbi:MAG: RloB family protein [Gammaproteobacteria bacterium]|nr:RloB family protein [Gammaproteobacteria bacterium]